MGMLHTGGSFFAISSTERSEQARSRLDRATRRPFRSVGHSDDNPNHGRPQTCIAHRIEMKSIGSSPIWRRKPEVIPGSKKRLGIAFSRSSIPWSESSLEDAPRRSADAEDIAQAVWLLLISDTGHALPAVSRHAPWLGLFGREREAAHVAGICEHPDEELAREPADEVLDPSPSPAALCEQRAEKAQIRSALADLRSALNQTSYQVVVLHFIEGRSITEICIRLGISRTCEYGRLRRAQ